MSQFILFNKPYGVLTQFTSEGGKACLKDFIDVPGVYAAGRLDADSEGLVVLTDDGRWQARISQPRYKLDKTYWVQVEGEPSAEALARMAGGLDLGDFTSAPCEVTALAEPVELWPRNPPIRYRAAIPTCWLRVVLREGKNRQVRRMTARIGHPTLRLVRWAVGAWTLDGLAPGQWVRAETPQTVISTVRRRPASADLSHSQTVPNHLRRGYP